MNSLPATVALLVVAVSSSALTGCSGPVNLPNVNQISAAASSDSPSSGLSGRLHGGQQPIVGARIYLLAAGTTGYGSAATSLLSAASYTGYPTQQDTNGRYYATSDSLGNFQIVDACTPGQQVYVASIGGNPGTGANSAANELAILGQCPEAGNFDTALTNVFVSEISTVAAAYAASAYAQDTFDIGGPGTTTLQQTAIANAFANAANLFDIQNINDFALTTTISGNGTVPQARIHTIANILASCINTAGPSSPSCSTLFTYAKSAGTSGTAPTDVTTAAINIAHNPWSGASILYNLQTANSPFSPVLSSAPADLSLSLTFANAALGNNPSLAVDATGDLWTVAPGGTAVTKLSPMGAILSGTGYAIGGGFTNARGLAVDTNNALWILGKSSGSLPTFAEMDGSGVYQQILTQPGLKVITYPPTNSTNLAVDGAGNLFYAAVASSVLGNSTNCCTMKFQPGTGAFTALNVGSSSPGTNFIAVNSSAQWTTGGTGTVAENSGSGAQSVSGGGLSAAVGVALDNAGNAWIANAGSSSVSEFSSAGKAISSTGGYTGGLSAPQAIAVDGLANAWVTNQTGSAVLSDLSGAGAPIGTGYGTSGLSSPAALAIDPSGNIWVASSASSTITEFLGIAAPVVTPLSAAVAAGSLGTRP